ncbi:hypothetical protein TPHA_0I02450 [Tetrapisispora phaffii CBS 4417]|uniref:Copper-fist domain-containing protein n=1 Tax=Tetrapisispora phaffii (strain ATCC 24235 / CBS 4417 / NBRC 1672 / NRRL Y-8282 / UCD 70-5) TaxID=1071381 RepID=G8BXX0_TETPH|nr:hypothetical protein TPHA_0I02450 [Tetrapisispora phaffii CBS 4417]CCE64748.1 hypothetical protein TPHA_0I02450 [Tetrapisispora phaffii CBS 4417]
MIIYQNDKYACVSCIRGHRSSTCKHTGRMLVKVRTRGRPTSCKTRKVIMVDKDSEVKVAKERNPENLLESSTSPDGSVDTQVGSAGNGVSSEVTLANDTDVDQGNSTGYDGKRSCVGMDANPILFLNVKKKQNAVFINGKLNIIVDDSSENDADANANVNLNVRPKLSDKENGFVRASSSLQDDKAFKYMLENEYIKRYVKDEKEDGKLNSTPNNPIKLCGCEGKGTAMKAYHDSKNKIDDKYLATHSKNLPVENSTPGAIEPVGVDETNTSNVDHYGIVSNSESTKYSNLCIGNYENPSKPDTDLLKYIDYDSNNPDSTIMMNDIVNNSNLMVELLTHKGLYLSSTCSCPDDNCPCSNCLLHRNETELNAYIQQSGIPLSEVGEAQILNTLVDDCSLADCKCTPETCQCTSCTIHLEELVSFDKIIFSGILHFPFRRKTKILFKNKIIPSRYWWDYIKIQLPRQSQTESGVTDIIKWFDSLISLYHFNLQDYDPTNQSSNLSNMHYL